MNKYTTTRKCWEKNVFFNKYCLQSEVCIPIALSSPDTLRGARGGGPGPYLFCQIQNGNQNTYSTTQN